MALLNFLDLKLQYSYMERCYSASVYIKATNTTLMGDFHALSPTSHKVSTLMSLLNRAYTHSSSWSSFAVEIDRIEKLMTKNAYPAKFVNNTIRNFVDVCVNGGGGSGGQTDESNLKLLSLQFRGSVTQMFAKKLRSLVDDVRIVYTTTKARNVFGPPKPIKKLEVNFNVVYQYKCPKCNACYIGRTKRLLYHRLGEHRKSAFGEHHLYCENNINILNECFTLIGRAKNFYDLKILEAIFIHTLRPSINTQMVAKGTDNVLSIKLFKFTLI